MAVPKVLRASLCAQCRVSMLWDLTSIGGLPQRFPRIPPRFSNHTRLNRFSTQSARRDDIKLSKLEESDSADKDIETKESEILPEIQDEQSSPAIPWYLQDDAAERKPAVLQRQPLPTLPLSPPPILEPLMEQLSIDLGLDDLSLIDLRKLDPPPALGANLIMLLGTARSEKHLHVSADRLCRWLRGTYGLRPDADGLLGRNELKLKLRRKMRRAKLVGSSLDETNDDGIRTGWVCVDAGTVESAEEEIEALTEQKGYTGFGRRTEGARIVVQMLTQDKRTQMDLEHLWEGILRRSLDEATPVTRESAEYDSSSTSTSASPVPNTAMPLQRNGASSQVRGFHTSARRVFPEPAISPIMHEGYQRGSFVTEPSSDLHFAVVYQEVVAYMEAGKFDLASSHANRYAELSQLHHDSDEWPLILTCLRKYLESLPGHKAIKELGGGGLDSSSTPFLSCFYSSISSFPLWPEWQAKLWLQCYARQLGHSGYTTSILLAHLGDAQLSGVRIPAKDYMRVIHSIVKTVDIPGQVMDRDSSLSQTRVLKILRDMQDEGHDLLSEDVLVSLQGAAAIIRVKSKSHQHALKVNPVQPVSPLGSSIGTFHLHSVAQTAIEQRLHALLMSVDLSTFSSQSISRLLQIYGASHQWEPFFDVWRSILRLGGSHSPAMWAFLLRKVAESKNQRACHAVLMTWVPDMKCQTRPILVEGEVAQGVKACIQVVEPEIERLAMDPDANSELVTLWRQCVGSIG